MRPGLRPLKKASARVPVGMSLFLEHTVWIRGLSEFVAIKESEPYEKSIIPNQSQYGELEVFEFCGAHFPGKGAWSLDSVLPITHQGSANLSCL